MHREPREPPLTSTAVIYLDDGSPQNPLGGATDIDWWFFQTHVINIVAKSAAGVCPSGERKAKLTSIIWSFRSRQLEALAHTPTHTRANDWALLALRGLNSSKCSHHCFPLKYTAACKHCGELQPVVSSKKLTHHLESLACLIMFCLEHFSPVLISGISRRQ